jgi:phosphoribosylformylglycinamidine synthase I
MRFAIIRFPGTWSDRDCYHVLHDVLEQQADILWHRETDLTGYDAVVLPGGFSYGDYLRCGAIARFSPVMEEVARFARAGRPVIGICNGFQVLCESGLLPGALIRNQSLQFRCEWTYLRREGGYTPWAGGLPDGDVIHIPISHGEGNYYADDTTLDQIEQGGRVAFRYWQPVAGVEPQRQCAEHRGHHQPAGQRARHDAPPGTRRGAPRRWHRRQPHLGIAHQGGATGRCLTPGWVGTGPAFGESP